MQPDAHAALPHPPFSPFAFHFVSLEVFSKVLLVQIQLIYQLLKEQTCTLSLLSFCVSAFITMHLRLNYSLYFHFLYEA